MKKPIRRVLPVLLLLAAMGMSSCRTAGSFSARSDSDGARAGRTTIDVPRNSSTKVNHAVLSQSTRGNTRVVIDIADQKGYLLVNCKVAVESPVSTARPGKWTPRGSFNMTERIRTGKISTIYGVSMPYWMRLNSTVYGVHAGHLPGYPASAGCVRLPSQAAELIFDNTTYGTRVNIYSNWDGA